MPKNKNPFREKEYDILDPEAKPKDSGHKGLGDIVNDAKEKVDDIRKTVERIGKIVKTLGPYGVLILLIIIVIIGFIGFITNMPGLTIDKLKEIATKAGDIVQSWFTTDSDAITNTDDLIELANYLEEMNYDLVSYGFVTPKFNGLDIKTYEEVIEEGYNHYELKEGDKNYRYYNDDGVAYDGEYYNAMGVRIDNATGEIVGGKTYEDKYGIIRSTEEINQLGTGKVEKIGLSQKKQFNLLRTYLMSDNRIYSIKNDDERLLNSVFENITSVFGGAQGAWSKGLMKFYLSTKGLATKTWGFWDGFLWKNDISINRSTKQLSIRRGYGNNPMNFSIEGWAPRYGLSLEFLLSLHLGTMAPDLVHAILQNFDTEIQVYLEDAGESKVEAMYVDPFTGNTGTEYGITRAQFREKLAEVSNPLFGSGINKETAQYLLVNLPLTSPSTCTGSFQQYVIEDATNDIQTFLGFDTSKDPFEEYGINDVDMDNAEKEFMHYSATTSDGQEIKNFDARHCAKSFGAGNSDFLDDNYRYMTPSNSTGYPSAEVTRDAPVVTEEKDVLKFRSVTLRWFWIGDR